MDAGRVLGLVEQLRRIGSDTQHVEAKRSRTTIPHKLNRSLCAFSNSDGGVILLGVDEQNGFAITGVDDPARIQDSVHNEARSITPVIHPTVHLIEVDEPSDGIESAVVVAVEVDALPRSQRPCFVTAQGRDTGSYYRSGDANQRLSPYAIDLLARDREHIDPSAQAVSGATLDDLDDALIAPFIATVRPKMRHLRTNEDTEILLNRQAVVSIDGTVRPTVGGLLAFGRHPQQYLTSVDVVFTAYPDPQSPARFADSATLQGPISDMIADTIAAVARNTRKGTTFVDGARIDTDAIPREIVRELVTNSLIHRDLAPAAWNQPVTVTLTGNQLTVTSPGGLVPPVTVSELLDPSLQELGAVAPHSARNPALVSLLADVAGHEGPLVERRGSGFPAIWHSINPEQSIDLTDIVTSLTATVTHEPLAVTPTTQHKGTAAERIIDHMHPNEWYSRSEIDDALQLNPRTTRKALESLIENGQVITNDQAPRSRQLRYRLVT